MNLRFLGLGLSSNMDARAEPAPYRLLAEVPGLFDYIEYSAPLSLERARAEASLFPELEASLDTTPALFHPVHLNLYGPELESAGALFELNAHALAVRSPWVSNDVAWWHTDGRPFPGYLYLAPRFDALHAEDAAAHALHVQSALDVPLLLENPTVLARRGELHALEFMSLLRAKTGLGLLLDIGHLYAHQLSRGLDLFAGLDNFDFDGVFEIHLAGGSVVTQAHRRFYLDDHPRPVIPEVYMLLETIVPHCRNLLALTFEGDGHSNQSTIEMLRRLRPLLESARKDGVAAPIPKLPNAQVPRPSITAPPEMRTRAQHIFESTHHGDLPEDQDGARFERDFRLEVLRQRLDRRMPRLRAQLAPKLDDFMTSGELFSGTDIYDSFARWARKQLIASPNDELARIWVEEVMRR
jgi:uncharacterized protein (UPF0276 family)